MQRRNVLTALAATLALPASAAVAQPTTQDAPTKSTAELRAEAALRMATLRTEALARFPFEIVQAPGASALQEWERLKSAGRGVPVVVGSDEELDALLLNNFHPTWSIQEDPPDVADVLAKADRIPNAAQRTLDKIGLVFARPPVGPWPDQPPASAGLSLSLNVLTGDPIETVQIVLVPTHDWTEVPAHLRFGGFEMNPPPESHSAAFRSWRDRYGAELVGMSFDTLNLRIATRPASRDEALTLAREQFRYCRDIVDQGVGTLSNLAAGLMADDWWYFWWD